MPGNPHFGEKNWLAQLRMLRNADDIVGKVMSQLRSQNELDNTIVVFLSDNGLLYGAHRLSGKRLPYTESIKVPAFIRWPNHIKPGSVDPRMSGNLDLAPTLLHAAGVKPNLVYPFDGRDLLDPSWRRPYLLAEHWHEPTRSANPWMPTWASLRSRYWQYIEYFSGSSTIFREYYNLKTDPSELSNTLAGPATTSGPNVAVLHKLLMQARTCVGAQCR
jgi:arylsulfatase A-like enzyme